MNQKINKKSRYYFLIFMIMNLTTIFLASEWKNNQILADFDLNKEVEELSVKESDYAILDSKEKEMEELFKSDFIYVDGSLTIDLKDFTEISYSEYLNKHKEEDIFKYEKYHKGFIDSNYDIYRETFWKKGETYVEVGVRTNNLNNYTKDLPPKKMLNSITTFNKKFKENSDENVVFGFNDRYESVLWDKTNEYVIYHNNATMTLFYYESLSKSVMEYSTNLLKFLLLIFFENFIIFFSFIYPRRKGSSMKDAYNLKPLRFRIINKMKDASKLSKESINKMSKMNKENKITNSDKSKEYKKDVVKIKNY